MKIAKHPNPFKQFMKSCGHQVSHVPSTSQENLLGASKFFEWTDDVNNADMYVITVDGFSSDVIFDTWEKFKFLYTFIPDFIANNEHAVIFFENGAEGHCDKNIFEFIHQVTQHYNLSNVYYGNSCVNISDLYKLSAYDSFDVLYTRNYKEDMMIDLEVNEYFDFDTSKTYLFNCLNNAPRPHRALLLGALLQSHFENQISSPDVEFDKVVSNTMEYIAHNYTSIEKIKKGIRYLETLKMHYPLQFDDRDENIVHMKEFGDVKKMLDCDLQIITESSVGKELYFTEKVFKPIMLKQPFLILGPIRILQHLKEMGYQTYEHLYTNQDVYDATLDIFDRIDILIDSLEILMIKKDNADMWGQIISQNKKCAEHNFRLFKNNSSQIIQKIDLDLDNWLEVYPEFVKIFKKG